MKNVIDPVGCLKIASSIFTIIDPLRDFSKKFAKTSKVIVILDQKYDIVVPANSYKKEIIEFTIIQKGDLPYDKYRENRTSIFLPNFENILGRCLCD